MSSKYAIGTKALGVCDICGRDYKLSKLRDVYMNRANTHVKACPTCWDKDHPQLFVGEIDATDPQALRNPRPEDNTASRELVLTSEEVAGMQALGLLDSLGDYTT